MGAHRGGDRAAPDRDSHPGGQYGAKRSRRVADGEHHRHAGPPRSGELPAPKPARVGLFALFVFATAARRPRDSELRFSAAMLGGLLAIAAAGAVARFTGQYQLLALTPFRTGPLFATLLFFLHLAALWRRSELGPGRPATSVLGLLGLAALPSPLVSAFESVQVTLSPSSRDVRGQPESEPGMVRAMAWVADSTNPGTTVILPPWRKDSFYRARRPQIASWEAVRYENLKEWRRRMEAMVGPLPEGQRVPWPALRRPYYELSEARIRELGQEFGASLILTRTGYHFPVRFEADSFVCTTFAFRERLQCVSKRVTPARNPRNRRTA